jgi:hypothetical protein
LSLRSAAGIDGGKLQSGVGWLLAALLLAALLLAAYVAMLRRYSVNFPFGDDFAQILRVPHYVASEGTLRQKLTYLFSLSVEHRVATLRLAALVQGHLLGGINFQVLVYFGNALLVVAGGLLIFTVAGAARPLLAAIAAALLLSPANYEAALLATGALQHFGVLSYVFAGLYCLSRRGVGWHVGASILILAAGFTSANGLMTFPAAVLLLGAMRRWRLALGWAVLGAVLFGTYFLGYQAPAYQPSLGAHLRDPLVPLRFFLVALGGLGHDASFALALGVLISLFWAFLILSGRIKSLPPAFVAWAVFLLLSFAAITWGRAGFGDQGALLSRYRVYSEFAALLSLVALYFQVPRALGMRLLWIALPLSLAWYIACWRYDVPELERFYIARTGSLDYYIAEGQVPPEDDPLPQAFRDFVLDGARQLGVYDPSVAAHAPRDPVADGRALDTTRALRVGIGPPTVGRRAMIVDVYGPGHEADAVAWLESDVRKYRFTLESMPPASLAFGRRTGFLWGVCALAQIAPGRYRLGVGVDDATSPAVLWSDYWVTVE